MKTFQKILMTLSLTALFVASVPAVAQAGKVVRYVSDFSDSTSERDGTLRKLLRVSCDNVGDDKIMFLDSEAGGVWINLVAPLVIPEDCQGSVVIQGATDFDVVLSGYALPEESQEPGDACMLHVYSDGHKISQLSLVNYQKGAAICVFGNDNTISNNRIGHGMSFDEAGNRYGVVVSNVYRSVAPDLSAENNVLLNNSISMNFRYGVFVHADQNELTGNQIFSNAADGLWIKAKSAIVSGNQIYGNGGCASARGYYVESSECYSGASWGGAGIYIANGSQNMTIGGPDFEENKNEIFHNYDGGILIENSSSNTGHKISHNLIYENFGSYLGIDLGDDGVDVLDGLDADSGANTKLNSLFYFQAFPFADSENYWAWGYSYSGESVELYTVSERDIAYKKYQGGGADFLTDFALSEAQFELWPEDFALQEGDFVTSLSFDAAGNTSEYSYAVEVGLDADMDGVLDIYEAESGSGVSRSDLADSDEDGLADGIEDRNRNGIWEPELGETSAYNADSDGDGLSDWAESHADGFYQEGEDANPLDADSDGDGLKDGQEDKNGDGVWQAYLGESNPLIADSDEDGISDGVDNCPHIYNPGQEEWFCDSAEGSGLKFWDRKPNRPLPDGFIRRL
ncbi:MAG: right-handed parallel beta-helix repeat-containing protein [Deltaproteobacteria bacterium]|nr:right-handed parallel beta-helix repeat-containing protein [Deltaproteobacteria bacterium]